MNTADWQHAEEAFHKILELPEDRRAAALAQLSPALRSIVENLLEADQSGDSIARTIQAAATLVPSSTAMAGNYRLVRQIGAGGMGAVYLGVRADDTFEKKVAVKFVLRAMDSPLLRERFDAERRILARLEHPAIARLLDAGETPEGQPYLILEYVEGRTIIDHARTAKLNVRQRIELMVKVCEAVQYAHQSLVVHRDIKPSNIMIDGSGSPKLLDFGIAKLIDPVGKAQAAATLFRLLTPDYASPEQMRGEPAGVASDVYSLGAVLYELLADTPPFRLAGMTPADAERAITQTGAPKPSVRNPALRRLLHGDLDNIVLMAMRKYAKERYQSVAEFAADLTRYLESRPVVARDYNPWERAVKFVRRHRIQTVAALVVSTTLLAGTAVTYRAAQKAEMAARVAIAERQRAIAERQRADEQRAEAARQAALANDHAREADKQRAVAAEQRAVAEHRYDEEQTAIARILQDIYVLGSLQGSVAARRGVLEKAVPYLEKLAADPRANDEVRENLAHAYESLGYLLASTTSTATGEDRPRGADLLRKARKILLTQHRADPKNREYLVGLAQTCTELAEVSANTASDLAETRAYFQEAVEKGRRAIELYPNDGYALQITMRAYIVRIMSLLRRDVRLVDPSDIAEYDRLSLVAANGNPQHPRRLDALAYIGTVQGTILASRGEFEKARPLLEETVALREKRVTIFPNDAGVQRMLLVAVTHLADTYANLDGPDSDRASKQYLRMIAMAERLAGDASDRTSQLNLSAGLARYASLRREAGDAAGALVYAERALAIAKTLAPPAETALSLHQNHLAALRTMAEIQNSLKKPDEAALWKQALTAAEGLAARFASDPSTLVHVARSAIRLAQLAAGGRQDDEAIALARKSLVFSERAVAATGGGPSYEHRLTQTRGEASLLLTAVAARRNDAALRAEARSLASQSAAGLGRFPAKQLVVDWPPSERDKVKVLAAN